MHRSVGTRAEAVRKPTWLAAVEVRPSSPVPIYHQLVLQFRSLFAAGIIEPGETLPSAAQLALRLGVSPGTMRNAIRALVALRILIRDGNHHSFARKTNSADGCGGYVDGARSREHIEHRLAR